LHISFELLFSLDMIAFQFTAFYTHLQHDYI
jgi:hypothetical protein